MSDILISKQALLDELEKLDWQELYLPAHFKDIIDDMPTFSQKPEHGWNGYIGREGGEDIKGETSNKNGYRININQKPYSELYERYKKYKNIPKHIPLSDDERAEFERYVLGEKKGELKL